MKNIIKRSAVIASALTLFGTGMVSVSAECVPAVSFGEPHVYVHENFKMTELNAKKKTIYVGQKYSLKLKGKNSKVIWKSADPSVAAINSKGVVTGRSSGNTVITAMLKGNKKVTAKWKITVENYGRKSIKFTSDAVIYEVPGKGNPEYKSYKHLDNVVAVKSISERNKLIKYIRKNYPDKDKFYKRSSVIKKLKTYDKNFFKNNVLIYSMSVTEGVSPKYVKGKTREVVKKYSKGKLTAYVKTIYSEALPDAALIDSELHTRFNCYFTVVNKKSVKNVKAYHSIDKAQK